MIIDLNILNGNDFVDTVLNPREVPQPITVEGLLCDHILITDLKKSYVLELTRVTLLISKVH